MAETSGKPHLERIDVLIGVILLHGLLLATVGFRFPDAGRPEAAGGQAVFLLGVSFVLGVAAHQMRTKTPTALAVLGQFLVLLILTYPLDRILELKYLAMALVLFQAVVYFDRFWWVSLVYLQGFLAVFLFHRVPIWGDTPLLLPWNHVVYMEVFGVTLAFLIHRFQVHQQSLDRMRSQILDLKTSIIDVYQLNQQFQDFAVAVRERAGDEERRRVTRDVHDILGFTLVNLRVFFEMALDQTREDQVRLREILHQGLDQCQGGLERARQVLRSLRKPDLGAPQWMQTVNRLVRNFHEVTKIRVEASWGNAAVRYEPEVQDFLVKFVQEAMTNSFRHGSATSISITFWADGSHLVARVLDNGIGSNVIIPGIGFTGMQERVDALGGTLNMGALDRGFLVEARVPVHLGEEP